MIIEIVALKIAEGIKRQVPDHKSSVSVLRHGIAIMLNLVSIISLTIFISILTGNTKQAVIALVGFAVLRQFSGGVHLKTGAWCIAVTTVLLTLISLINLSVPVIQTLNILSLILVSLFAPSKIEKQSRIPKEHYFKLRIICIMFVIVSIVVQSPTLAVAFFVQALSLIHRREVKPHDTL